MNEMNVTDSNKQNQNEGDVLEDILYDGFYQISAFADKIGMALVTVDSWFKAMEEQKIHYISREKNNGRKIYDNLDLEIGMYIRDQRKLGIPLNLIYEMVNRKFEVRPFPNNPDVKEEIIDIESFKVSLSKQIEDEGKKILYSIEKMLEEFREEYAPIKTNIAEFNKQLSVLENVEESFRGLLTNESKQQDEFSEEIENKLRNEALKEWEKKDKKVRYQKIGLFAAAENITARDIFVQEYIELAKRNTKE